MIQRFATHYPEVTAELLAEGSTLCLSDYTKKGVVGIESWNQFTHWPDWKEETEEWAAEFVGDTDYQVVIMVHVAGDEEGLCVGEIDLPTLNAIDLQVYEYSVSHDGGWRQATNTEKYDLLFG